MPTLGPRLLASREGMRGRGDALRHLRLPIGTAFLGLVAPAR